MNRLIVLTLLLGVIAGPSARAEGPTTAEAASRAWAITDTVLARHVEPPLRQQMLLAGIRRMALEARGAVPVDLSRQVSDLTNPEQLAILLTHVLGSRKVEGVPRTLRLLPIRDEMTPEDVFLEGVLSAVPGGATLISEKDRKVQESFEANLYVGVQIKLGVDEKAKRPVFLEIFEGGPADNAGAKAGDLIEELDSVSTASMPIRQVVNRPEGPKGLTSSSASDARRPARSSPDR